MDQKQDPPRAASCKEKHSATFASAQIRVHLPSNCAACSRLSRLRWSSEGARCDEADLPATKAWDALFKGSTQHTSVASGLRRPWAVMIVLGQISHDVLDRPLHGNSHSNRPWEDTPISHHNDHQTGHRIVRGRTGQPWSLLHRRHL
jgi:hypothetical protein